jgi:hypothetical protein
MEGLRTATAGRAQGANGAGQGGTQIGSDSGQPRINPSYFAPGYYRVFAHYYNDQANVGDRHLHFAAFQPGAEHCRHGVPLRLLEVARLGSDVKIVNAAVQIH